MDPEKLKNKLFYNRKELLNIVKDMRKTIRKERITPEEKKDLLIELDILKKEVSKHSPIIDRLREITGSFSSRAALGEFVEKINELLGFLPH